MRLFRPGSSRLALISATAGVACLAFAAPAWATAGTQQSNVPVLASGNDPKGANGTIKIDDDVPVDDGIENEPHVTCDFAVKFFNFDNGQRANIIFEMHKPTGSDTVLLHRDDVLVSTDPAGGGNPDPDEVFTFSASDLGLAAYTPQPQQGYHVKLTVEIIGAPGAGKHKVFWVQPCTQSPSSNPGGGHNGGGSNNGGGNNGGGSVAGGSTNGGGNGNASGTGSTPTAQPAVQPKASTPTAVRLTGALPITGSAIASVFALGVVLIAAGVSAVVILRRRRAINL
jgi:hypothetical protein